MNARRDFMPFGEEITPDGTHRTTNLKYNFGDNVRQKFTGYQKDEETQLDFAEARMYQNLHARFTAVDPLLASGKSANPQTFNRYVYVINNPLILVDPDGLQVATASGRVFRKGGTFRIYRGDKPEAGFEPVTRTINTTTTIKGVTHHWQIRPNGWTVGDRVDGAQFGPAPAPATSQTRSDISVFAGEVVEGVKDGGVGILKGVGNAPAVGLNGVTWLTLNFGVGGFYFQGSNPLAVPMPFAYDNARQADYGSGSSTGFLLGVGGAAGTIFGGSAMPSAVPATSRNLTVYRVFGGDSRAQGFSWTTTNPTTVRNFRDVAGLPSGGVESGGVTNTAEFMIQGHVNRANIIQSRPALRLDGNKGGLPELIINPENVTITGFRVLKP